MYVYTSWNAWLYSTFHYESEYVSNNVTVLISIDRLHTYVRIYYCGILNNNPVFNDFVSSSARELLLSNKNMERVRIFYACVFYLYVTWLCTFVCDNMCVSVCVYVCVACVCVRMCVCMCGCFFAAISSVSRLFISLSFQFILLFSISLSFLPWRIP